MPGIHKDEKENANHDQQQPVREVTLTDRLNKHLLESFLKKLNERDLTQRTVWDDINEAVSGDENEFKDQEMIYPSPEDLITGDAQEQENPSN